jgi:RNA polymerase sigma factor (sigma-70 family)
MVCKNRWLNEIEKRKTKKVTFVEDTGFISNNADDDGVKNMKLKEDKFEIIQAALQKVGEGCNELLKLSWKGLGMEEVGVQLNMTYAYVRKKKSECMGKLVDLVKKENNYQVLFN